jgi:hypothetical protein
MKPQKTATQIKKEKEEKILKKIVAKIIAFEKRFPPHLVERACYRYKNANAERRSAESKIKSLETQLQEVKSRLQ